MMDLWLHFIYFFVSVVLKGGYLVLCKIIIQFVQILTFKK